MNEKLIFAVFFSNIVLIVACAVFFFMVSLKIHDLEILLKRVTHAPYGQQAPERSQDIQEQLYDEYDTLGDIVEKKQRKPLSILSKLSPKRRQELEGNRNDIFD